MPLKTLKYVVIEADTRTLELFLGLCSVSWGMKFLWFYDPAMSPFSSLVSIFGGPILWGLWSLVSGSFQVLSICYKRMRKQAAILNGIYWIFTSYALNPLDAVMFAPISAGLFALAQLWIILHRSSVEG